MMKCQSPQLNLEVTLRDHSYPTHLLELTHARLYLNYIQGLEILHPQCTIEYQY